MLRQVLQDQNLVFKKIIPVKNYISYIKLVQDTNTIVLYNNNYLYFIWHYLLKLRKIEFHLLLLHCFVHHTKDKNPCFESQVSKK